MMHRLPLILAIGFVKDIVFAIDAEDTILQHALPEARINIEKGHRASGREDLPLVLHALNLVIHAKHNLTTVFVLIIIFDIIVGIIEI
jgi:hypothetical protein